MMLLGAAYYGAAMTPAEAGCPRSGLFFSQIECTGDLSGGVSFFDFIDKGDFPNNLVLDVHDVDGDIEPSAGLAGIVFYNLSFDGEDDGVGVGEHGIPGFPIQLTYAGGDSTIRTQGSSGGSSPHGIIAASRAGDGGSSGSVAGFGSDGANGGIGGNLTLNVSGAIVIDTVAGAHGGTGIVAISLGGSGSDGTGGLTAGTGGAAGGGGNVTVTNSASILTKGSASGGIWALTAGGNGGAGGDAGGIWASAGGGNRAAPGGRIVINNTGAIETQGAYSIGILAQSIGGYGGAGGDAGGLFAWGGDGASAGNGGQVSLGNFDTIDTAGKGSHGIFGQSIGGGGGSGGSAGGLIALGAGGSVGGDGGVVAIENGVGADIHTREDDANALYAQSIGGGGGDGGSGGAIFVAIGGSGASGGNGGSALIYNDASLTTEGNNSNAIFAQSVGGGGGNGGTAVAAGILFSAAFGGSGALGGDGGTVKVNDTTDVNTLTATAIATVGVQSNGIFAQSIGGGGGSGGLAASVAVSTFPFPAFGASFGGSGGAGGAGGAVTVNERGTIQTEGALASGIFAQSVGGGGGNGGGAVSVTANGGGISASLSMGGSGGEGGSGGAVTVNGLGSITTSDVLSHGIHAQSIGGGGGNGGYSVSASVGAMTGTLALGGAGGSGGDGKAVTVTMAPDGSDDAIVTAADASIGILAQSIGGGGGNGGVAGTVGVGGASLGIGLGGKAGSGEGDENDSGGNGGKVALSNAVMVSTSGVLASGIVAQSIGGGGGNGGGAYGASLGMVSGAIEVGGAGGLGGSSDEVTVTNTGAVRTEGALSYGIMAQSIGGGGGNGGNAVAFSVGAAVDKIPAGALAIGVGGSGGVGGHGNLVRVVNTAALETSGDRTHAILAQSIGGGGGNGGYAASGAITIGKGASIGVSVGGSGEGAGFGGGVAVGWDENGIGVAGTSIVTHGDGANAIHAQSIGGGGGEGGLGLALTLGDNFTSEGTALNVNVTVGGGGGGGGNGNWVDVYSDQLIRTFGNNAIGIFGQSVGGGGGNAGNAVSGLVTFTDDSSSTSKEISIGVSVGGSGGFGGWGDQVTITNVDAIMTGGPVLDDAGVIVEDDQGNPIIAGGGSHGILAQSIGGGGGIGGRANTINVVTGKGCSGTCPPTAKTDVKLSVAVGGSGGSGGGSVGVRVDNAGEIVTLGDTASGIYAQSIGGGGGDGGNGILGSEELIPENDLPSFPDRSNTKVYSDLSVAVGGSSGVSGSGGIVDIVNRGNILTMGSNSDGIFAQSIGGGGGVGGRAAVGASGTVGIGGKGGAGGNGHVVLVDSPDGSLIETVGDASFGIFAQSVGGGGGLAGNVDRMLVDAVGPVPELELGIGAAFGQGGGSGGDGGAVSVTGSGTIITHGAGSTAIFAQSVGGGGGLMGSLGNEEVGGIGSWAIGSNGDSGNSGKVTVEFSGTIETHGANSTAVFAQSAAGSGVGGKGISGGVSVDLSGTVVTHGLGSIAMLADATGEVSNGNINIMLDDETDVIVGGDSDENQSGVGVYLLGGIANELTSHGLLMTLGGVERGYAVAGGAGGDKIMNHGTVVGSLDLGGGANSFINEIAAFANFGAIASVGSGNTASNYGWMSPGGAERVMTTEVMGSMHQDGLGVYAVDLDLDRTEFDDESDLFQISETAEFDGTVDVTIHNAGSVLPGEHQALIARTAGGLTDNGTALLAPASAVVTYTLETDSNDMWIGYAVDFAPDGLNTNQDALGEYINAFQLAGNSLDLQPAIETLVFLPELDVYAAALDQLSPEVYVETENATVLSNVRFGRSLMDCPRNEDGERDKGCVWFQGGGEQLQRSATSEYLGYDETAFDVSGGFGGNLGEKGAAVVGFSYGQSQIDTEDLASSSGQRFQGGIGLSATQNGATFAIAALGGAALYDVERSIDFVDPGVTAKGDQKIYFGGGQVRLAHEAKSGAFRFAPQFEAWGGYFYHEEVSETGAGAIGLDVEAGGDFFAAIRPALTLAAEFTSNEGGVFRPFITGGFTYFVAGNDMSVTSTFQGEENAVPGFSTASALEEYYVDAAAGFDMKAASGIALRLEGSAQYAENFLSYGGNAKFVAPF